MHPPDRPAHFEEVPRTPLTPLGRTGIDRSREGLPDTEPNPNLKPYLARGLAPDLGEYHRMLMSDGTIAGSFGLISRGISSATWRVKRPNDPTPLEAEAADFVERFLGLDGTLGWLEGGLPEHLRHACLAIAYGFSAFEVSWSVQSWRGSIYTVPSKVAWRAPWSVKGWVWDRDDLVGMVQQSPDAPSGGASTGSLSGALGSMLSSFGGRPAVAIPVERLLLYTYSPIGLTQGSPEGMSLFRPVWAWWRAKRQTLCTHMAAHERYADGLYILQELALASGLPYPSRSQQDIDDFDDGMDMLEGGETNYLSVPGAYNLHHTQPLKNLVSPEKLLEYFDHQIRLVLSAQLLGLGARTSGGLSDSFGQLLFQAIDAIARQLVETMNGQPGRPWTGLICDMVNANFTVPDDFRYPKVEPVGIKNVDQKAMIDAITKALQFKGVLPSVAIERQLLSELDMPDLTPDEIEEREVIYEAIREALAGLSTQADEAEQNRASEEGTQAPVVPPEQDPVADPENV